MEEAENHYEQSKQKFRKIVRNNEEKIDRISMVFDTKIEKIIQETKRLIHNAKCSSEEISNVYPKEIKNLESVIVDAKEHSHIA